MQNIPAVEAEIQVSSVPEVRPTRKIGIDVMRSDDVEHRFYFGPRPGRGSVPRQFQLKHDHMDGNL